MSYSATQRQRNTEICYLQHKTPEACYHAILSSNINLVIDHQLSAGSCKLKLWTTSPILGGAVLPKSYVYVRDLFLTTNLIRHK